MTANRYRVSSVVENSIEGFPAGSVVKNLPPSAGDISLIPGPGGCSMLWSN